MNLVSNVEYCPDCFIKAVRANRELFKPGTFLQIITAEQLINKGPQEQKISFVFLAYCNQSIAYLNRWLGEQNPGVVSNWVGIAGARFGGDGLLDTNSPVDCCWWQVEKLHPGDIKAKRIKYISGNVLSHFLKEFPEVITNLILNYTL